MEKLLLDNLLIEFSCEVKIDFVGDLSEKFSTIF